MLGRVREALGKLLDLDSLLLHYTYAPKSATPRSAKQAIDTLLALKHTLQLLPQLSAALTGAEHPLLATIATALQAPALTALRTRIEEVLTEETTWARTPLQMRQQECFAVRPGIDGALDAVRKVGNRCSSIR